MWRRYSNAPVTDESARAPDAHALDVFKFNSIYTKQTNDSRRKKSTGVNLPGDIPVCPVLADGSATEEETPAKKGAKLRQPYPSSNTVAESLT